MTHKIKIPAGPGGFAEDKDQARALRTERIVPALAAGEKVVLDFSAVSYATQSFVHALVGEPLKRFGDSALENLEFRNCTIQLQNVIELVVDYSLGGFPEPGTGAA